MKIYQILSFLNFNDIMICLRDCPFELDRGIVDLHKSKVTHWVAYINEKYFYPYGCVPPQKLSGINLKRNG